MTEERLVEIEGKIAFREKIGSRPNPLEETLPELIAEIRRCWGRIEELERSVEDGCSSVSVEE